MFKRTLYFSAFPFHWSLYLPTWFQAGHVERKYAKVCPEILASILTVRAEYSRATKRLLSSGLKCQSKNGDREIERCKRERENENGGPSPAAAPAQFCDCVELIVGGQRVPCPAGHDCDYVAAR